MPRTPEQKRARNIVTLILCGGLVGGAVVGLVWGAAADVGSARPSAQTDAVSVAPSEAPSPAASASPAAAPSTSSTSAPADPSATPAPAVEGAVVDASAVDRGLVPEPVTRDPAAYGIQAARALVSFDTTRVSRDQFRDYIASWVGNDPRYGTDPAVLRDTRARKLDVIDTRIIGDSSRWEELALDKSVITAEPTGVMKVDYDHVEPRPDEIGALVGAGFHLVTVELTVTTTGTQGGQPMAISTPLTVSMQIDCRGSLPVGSTPQVSGDCKVVQFLPKPTI